MSLPSHNRREFLRAAGGALAGGCATGLAPGSPRVQAAEDADPARLERIRFRDSGDRPRDVSGRVLAEARDGGLLLQGRDGRLWTIERPRLTLREATGEKFVPVTRDEQIAGLANELPAGVEFAPTRRYVIATTAGKPYAQWCGALFERLYSAFQNYWKQRDLEPQEPEFPLTAIVLANEREFATYATRDAGPDAATAKGYYSIEHNRIVIYDLTASAQGPAATTAEINRRLGAMPFNIATVVHEATHQIAFNSGLHTRLADNPLWLTEGMAMFFETPDLSSRTGWKTVGQVNDLRLRQFQELLARGRPADSLEKLLGTDTRLTQAESAGEAYAEAWALTYFLAKAKKKVYAEYLRRISRKPRLIWDTPEARLSDFRETIATDLKQFDAEFLRYMKKLRG